jgi:hypothetical protein
MSTFRAILVALVAMSVALLPVPGGMTAAQLPAATMTAVQPDCCAHGKPCEQKGTKDCGSLAGCALKCFSLSVAAVGPTAMTSPAEVVAKFAFIAQAFPSASDNPPLPPPRV